MKETLPDLVNHAPFSTKTEVYIGQKVSSVYAIDAHTGLLRHTYLPNESPPDVTTPPGSTKGSLPSNTLYIGRTEYTCAMFSKNSNNPRWNITLALFSNEVPGTDPSGLEDGVFLGSDRTRLIHKTWNVQLDSPVINAFRISTSGVLLRIHSQLHPDAFVAKGSGGGSYANIKALNTNTGAVRLDQANVQEPATRYTHALKILSTEGGVLYSLPSPFQVETGSGHNPGITCVDCHDAQDRHTDTDRTPWVREFCTPGPGGHFPACLMNQFLPLQFLALAGPEKSFLYPAPAYNFTAPHRITYVASEMNQRPMNTLHYAMLPTVVLLFAAVAGFFFYKRTRLVTSLKKASGVIRIESGATKGIEGDMTNSGVVTTLNLQPTLHLHQHSPVSHVPQVGSKFLYGTLPSPREQLGNGQTRIGKLRVTQTLLGHGSSGTVIYQGEFETQPVAIKRMLLEYYHVAENEVELLRSMDHPNVVRYFCLEQDLQFLYIGLELCLATLVQVVEGPTTSTRGTFHGCRLDIVILTQIDRKLLSHNCVAGLRYLHANNIVHRDIKPQNVLIASKNISQPTKYIAKISDFGLCKQLQDDESHFQTSDVGTRGWMAPELMKKQNGDHCSTKAVDIFSLGCVFHYLVYGTHPFGK